MHEYGLNLERAQHDGTSVEFVANLVDQLPQMQQVNNHDAAWTLTDTLLAMLVNQIAALSWGLGGGKGQKPGRIGPSWLIQAGNSLPATVMPIEELERRLKEFDEKARHQKTQAIVQTF